VFPSKTFITDCSNIIDICKFGVINMARRKQKTEPKEVTEDENVVDTYNALDMIETVSETVPEPTVVNNYDVMLPRSVSRYVKPLR